MSNTQFLNPTNPNPNQTHLVDPVTGVREPNQDADVNAVDLAHPGAPNDFRNRAVPVGGISHPAPEPGSESAGPAMFNLVQETARSILVQNDLIQKAIPLLNSRTVTERVAVQTDANGNADVILYRVPQGFQFYSQRITVEDGTHTPGAPFSAAGAWLGIIVGDKFQPGSLKDFAPNPGNAGATPLIPFLFSDGNEEQALFRGGEQISLHVVGTVTLANVDIFATIQGRLFPL